MSSDNLAFTPFKYELGELKFSALGDRVLVLEDDFKTGYECTGCQGKRSIPCADCHGKGVNVSELPSSEDPLKVTTVEKKCSQCDGKCTITCPVCNGKGGLLIAPEVSERRPASGTIVSAGPGKFDNNGNLIPMAVKVGEGVLYSNFAGYVVDLTRATGEKITLRILHESELLCGLEGHLTLTNLRGKSEIAQFNP